MTTAGWNDYSDAASSSNDFLPREVCEECGLQMRSHSLSQHQLTLKMTVCTLASWRNAKYQNSDSYANVNTLVAALWCQSAFLEWEKQALSSLNQLRKSTVNTTVTTFWEGVCCRIYERDATATGKRCNRMELLPIQHGIPQTFCNERTLTSSNQLCGHQIALIWIRLTTQFGEPFNRKSTSVGNLGQLRNCAIVV